jgi:integrase/recombinase XerD
MEPSFFTFDDSLLTYLRQHYSPETAKAYRREIENYLGNYPAAPTANYQDVTKYIGLLRSRYSKASTLNRIVSGIKVYYDYLCSEGMRSDNPARAIRLRDKRSRDIQLQDLFTGEELEILLNRKERYTHLDYRNKVLCSLLIYQALYPQEMEAIAVGDINLQEGNMYIKPTAKTNGRSLPLRPNQVLLFHQYISEIRPKLLGVGLPPAGELKGAALLIGIRGKPMTGEDITKHIKRLAASSPLGVRGKVTAQTIRQSVIANLLKQGHDIGVVQAFAGHKYPSSTQRYKQSEVETLQAAVNKYHPLK